MPCKVYLFGVLAHNRVRKVIVAVCVQLGNEDKKILKAEESIAVDMSGSKIDVKVA